MSDNLDGSDAASLRADGAAGEAKGSPDEAIVQEARAGSRRKRAVAIGLAALLAAAALAAFFFLQRDSGFFDPNAQEGQAPYKTEEEVKAELDRIVEEGMFNISISSVIKFADGTSEGIAYIENVPGNRYHMQVTINLDDSGEEVYRSAAIAPGSYVEKIALSSDLDPGTYDATATFTALEQDTHEEAGKAAAKVSLVVEG